MEGRGHLKQVLRIRPRLTYANVMATLGVFIALGAGAYAALRIPPNSIGTRQLKARSVTNGKLAEGAVTASKVAEHTLTRLNIDMAALGTVPMSADSEVAAEALRLSGHSASCPQGTTLIRGLCFDSESNPPAPNVEAAATDCAAKGGWLPTPMQLYSTKGSLALGNGQGASQHQFTDVLYSAPHTNNEYTTIVVSGSGLPEELPAGNPSAYYCVYPLLR